MKKKILLIILVLLICTSVSLFATGIGIAGIAAGSSGGGYYGGLLTVDVANITTGFAVYSAADGPYMGIIANYYILSGNLSGKVNGQIGFGPFMNFQISDFGHYIVGARLPVSVNMFLSDSIELFLEGAPFLGYDLDASGIYWGAQAAYGLRFLL